MQARSETDDAKRAAMYAEMQQILHDDGGVIVIMFNNYVSAHWKEVAHGELHSTDMTTVYERLNYGVFAWNVAAS